MSLRAGLHKSRHKAAPGCKALAEAGGGTSADALYTLTQTMDGLVQQQLSGAASCARPSTLHQQLSWGHVTPLAGHRRRRVTSHVRGGLCSRPGDQPVSLHAERAAPDAGLHRRLQQRRRRQLRAASEPVSSHATKPKPKQLPVCARSSESLFDPGARGEELCSG